MSDNFAIPSDLSPRAREAAEIVLAHAAAMGVKPDGHSKLFYSAAEWRARGERYGRNADLIVVHDDESTLRVFRAAKYELEKKGFYSEEAETWYSVVRKEPLDKRRD